MGKASVRGDFGSADAFSPLPPLYRSRFVSGYPHVLEREEEKKRSKIESVPCLCLVSGSYKNNGLFFLSFISGVLFNLSIY